MSGADDVWSPSDEAPPRPPRAAYGEGLWINQAFSVELALRLGVALLRERPGLMLGGGFGLWVLTNLPTALSLPADFASGFFRAGGDEQAALVADLLGNLVTLGTLALVFPFQWWLITGVLRTAAAHVEGRETGPVWSHWSEALRVMGNRIVSGLLMLAVLALVLGPIGLVGAAIAVTASFELGIVVLLVGLLGGLFAAYVYVWLPLALGTLACAVDGAGPIEGLRIGWTAGNGARATLFVFGLVFGVLAIAGTCLFCVGQIPVYSLFLGAVAGGWVLYARPEDTLRRSPFFERNPVEWL